MEEQYLSVILLLGDQDEAAVRACSVAVCAGRQAASQLDGSYVPHLTVVRFAARPEEASALWEEVKEYSHRPSSLMSEGLCFSPHSSGTSCELFVRHPRERAEGEIVLSPGHGRWRRRFHLEALRSG